MAWLGRAMGGEAGGFGASLTWSGLKAYGLVTNTDMEMICQAKRWQQSIMDSIKKIKINRTGTFFDLKK